jgi:hypothetical protein
LQAGQPFAPLRLAKTIDEIAFWKTCSDPSGHLNQTSILEPTENWFGLKLRFFVLCHIAAISGNSSESGVRCRISGASVKVSILILRKGIYKFLSPGYFEEFYKPISYLLHELFFY